ncbi:RES family NAD+ phosphorylase [Delftia sp. Lp-1]|uniref:RES family NAD+ phosphorylase n=1 Tax=Delftia sp. Lp-1 TaxID=682863 RepID=UPI001E369A63|nr:RES family NAD+ phosphorylase [Delftia sp. Lp-1]MCB4788314.1 RES family NAD+ phosphorylase [Delftia sp. Lp-1]
MTLYCCAECFGDHGLRRSVIPSRTNVRGQCDFCNTADIDLVEPGTLAAEFEMLTSIYELNSGGKLLVEWLKEDWGLFPKLDLANAKNLLMEVLDDGEIVRRLFSPSQTFKSEGLAAWTTLRDELMFKNRYFLDEALDKDRLSVLLSHLTTSEIPPVWYRARITTSDAGFDIGQMGAPPRELASHGRANPSGIPYLYLGSMPDTAIAEIRPHTGEIASVARFTLEGIITAVDLRNPRGLVSPFLLQDASEVGRMRADVPFLEKLGSELTRPVLPRSAAIDYLPSQYLCEFIKKIGYDGVLYRSSVSDGINLALFSPAKAVANDVCLYDVQRVSVAVGRR